MGREAVRSERRRTGAPSEAPSPFILWEGGRDGRSDALARPEGSTPSDPLGLSMPAPRLFSADADEPPTCMAGGNATAVAMAVAPSPALSRTLHDAGDLAESGDGRRPLDWRLIGASVLVCLVVALGAIIGKGLVLGDAYARLSWEDHRVAAGETIDSILAQRDLPDVGLERLASWTLERNGLDDALIVPGQVLSVPR